jgi:rubrerythrin
MAMAERLTLGEVLDHAIQKEIMSRSLYFDLRQKARNQSAKDAFQSLADQEEKHRHILEEYLQGKMKEGTLSHGLVVDYKIADCLDQPEITPEMDLKEVFLLAANKERASHELYSGLAEIHPEGRTKRLLEDLAAQELEHKQRVETLYTEVAFPQTDGG